MAKIRYDQHGTVASLLENVKKRIENLADCFDRQGMIGYANLGVSEFDPFKEYEGKPFGSDGESFEEFLERENVWLSPEGTATCLSAYLEYFTSVVCLFVTRDGNFLYVDVDELEYSCDDYENIAVTGNLEYISNVVATKIFLETEREMYMEHLAEESLMHRFDMDVEETVER